MSSLGDALKWGGGRGNANKEMHPHLTPFYRPESLALNYEGLVKKIRSKLVAAARIEAEALAEMLTRPRSDLWLEAEGFLLGVRPSGIRGAG
eukprot:CAMPEP_0173403400 /NCGR_PEP_ID=MMETSP1356-20130122/56689_1 /TAXON_ID=77927 ORGANISM="Hemiselmis virescens, Strain PCC157" /NCGR_SAMPLE_ID=MMETSP1356 /ASSEMBLY_ACC=CAM_ASM_000847 /LENGTH=91 /DNA_ID=CAMNT_0014363923 /DNA_START=24 /DNA_END=296 /DNA_ORIENTATION=+